MNLNEGVRPAMGRCRTSGRRRNRHRGVPPKSASRAASGRCSISQQSSSSSTSMKQFTLGLAVVLGLACAATATEPKRLLVVGATASFRHPSVENGEKTIRQLAEESGGQFTAIFMSASPYPKYPAPGPRGGGGNGFYLPFNWRGFHDFGSSLIGDWGVHILGPANWALQLSPESLISVECIKKDPSPPFTFPDELTIKYEFAARPGMPPVTVYWYHHAGGDAYTPAGMTADEARKIPDQGPQVGPAGGGFGGGRGRGPGGTNVPAAGGTNAPTAAGGPGGRPGGPGGGRGSGYNSSSSAPKVTWAPVDAAKVSACCPVRAGRNTNCRPPISRVRPARARATITARIAATGCARAKAERPPARTSASAASTPNGCCSGRWRCISTANFCGAPRRVKSPTSKRRTNG